MRIDRCVCFHTPFSDLQALADKTGRTSIEALQAIHPFGSNCGLCMPYVRRMLASGETVFHEIVTDADSPVDTP